MAKRRKKNKKKQSEGILFPPRLAAVLVLAAILSLSYLWLCGRCDALGRSIKGLETQHAEVRRRAMNEEYKWSNMKSPRNIENLLAQHNIRMVWPDERHIVRIRLANGPEKAAPRKYAQAND